MARSRLRDALEAEIAEGRLAPGERLDEMERARRFGVSRPPIRGALMHLAARRSPARTRSAITRIRTS